MLITMMIVIIMQGSEIVKIDDQDTTDLTKCINHIVQLHKGGIVKVIDYHLITVYMLMIRWMPYW